MLGPDRRRDRGGLVLVTGATGYIGGRLVPVLLRRGERCGASPGIRGGSRAAAGPVSRSWPVTSSRCACRCSPRLSSCWCDLVTPGPASIARPLIEKLRTEVVGSDPSAASLFGGLPMGYRGAVRRALDPAERRPATVWSGALVSGEDRTAPPGSLEPASGTVRERLRVRAAAGPPETFAVLAGLDGRRGCLYGHWLWRLRGAVDRMAGGVGLRRGRRDPDTLRPGDALDGWRLEEVSGSRLLRLRAEMKMPGRAWLEWEVTPDGEGGSIVARTAWFEPRGLPGRLYWHALLPVHRPMFRGMLHAAARRAEAPAGAQAGHLAAGHAPERASSP